MRRHLEPVPRELRSLADEVSEPRVVIAVIRARYHVARQEQFHSRLETMEALRPRIDQPWKSADIHRRDQVSEVHPETRGFRLQPMVEEAAFQSALEALRSLRIKDLLSKKGLADAETNRRGFEGVPIVSVQTQGVLLLLPNREHGSEIRADVSIGAV